MILPGPPGSALPSSLSAGVKQDILDLLIPMKYATDSNPQKTPRVPVANPRPRMYVDPSRSNPGQCLIYRLNRSAGSEGRWVAIR